MAASLYLAEHAWGDHYDQQGGVFEACDCSFDSLCKC